MLLCAVELLYMLCFAEVLLHMLCVVDVLHYVALLCIFLDIFSACSSTFVVKICLPFFSLCLLWCVAMCCTGNCKTQLGRVSVCKFDMLFIASIQVSNVFIITGLGRTFEANSFRHSFYKTDFRRRHDLLPEKNTD